ncbi:hypothetical protein [Mycobacterium sp.]|uniref:hypothetical protein n=1 Tax=Mycobacterium sp. TaxID=1785 RepID=UPI00263492F1|nr:hypothetical protein [Mycobacterium sp.]
MLLFQITDLLGVVKATCWQHEGGGVDIPLMDSRTATLKLSVYDPNVIEVKPLERMLKVFYNGHLEFWGVMLTPTWSSTADGDPAVQINAHDPTIWWKKNNHRYGDRVLKGFPIDGRGLWQLAESAIPLQEQLARGIPHPGIFFGTDESTHTGPKPADMQNPQPGDGLWSVATRGQVVWETVQQLGEAIVGPEWDLRPVDADHPGVTSTWQPGYYCELNAWDQRGVDRSGDVIFHHGFGRNNLDGFEWTPDGNSVVNYQVEVYPGGEKNSGDTARRAMAHNEASWLKYGIYEGWESSNSKDPQNVLQAKADLYVDTYSDPPDFITITPVAENGTGDPAAEQPYRYIDDFTVGDTIRAACKRGYMLVDVAARVMKVSLAAAASGQVKTTMDCVPDLTLGFDQSDPGS